MCAETLENLSKHHHFCILLMLTVAMQSSYCFIGHVELLLRHYKSHLIYVAATLLRGNTQMCRIMLFCVSFLLIMQSWPQFFKASPHSVCWDLCLPVCAQAGSTRRGSSSALLRRQIRTHTHTLTSKKSRLLLIHLDVFIHGPSPPLPQSSTCFRVLPQC